MNTQTETKIIPEPFKCDQCNQSTINGVMVHESGCSNHGRNYSDEFLDSLVDQLNSQAKWVDEYNTENTDNPYAEFAYSFGYGDDEPRFDGLEPETKEIIDVITAAGFDRKALFDILQSCSQLECVDIYCRTNEIYSVIMGEIEDEVYLDNSPFNSFDLDTLGQADVDYLNRHGDFYYRGGYLYLNHSYDRWVMVLDHDMLVEYCLNDETLYGPTKHLIGEEQD